MNWKRCIRTFNASNTENTRNESCVKKAKALSKIYYKTRTEEAHEALKQAESERAKQKYKEHTKEETKRTTEWRKEQSKIIVKCEHCNIELKRPSIRAHLKATKHLINIENENEINTNSFL